MAVEVKFTVASVVEIDILGEPRVFPILPEDGGLIARLSAWEISQKILPWRVTHTGGGRRLAYYRAEDAERVREWLLKDGAKASKAVLSR